VRKFRSLRYTIDEAAPNTLLKYRALTEVGTISSPMWPAQWKTQAPAPRLQSTVEELSSAQSRRADCSDRWRTGRAQHSQLLHIDVYVGGTLRAQVVALLHEYSHAVGLLPVDGGSFAASNFPRKIRRSCCGIVAPRWKRPGNARACSCIPEQGHFHRACSDKPKGTLVSALGCYLSVVIDTPIAATIVITFGGIFVLMFFLHLIMQPWTQHPRTRSCHFPSRRSRNGLFLLSASWLTQ